VSANPIRAVVAYAHVVSVPKSIDFYAKLGFRVQNSVAIDGGPEPTWAYLIQEGAQLMIARATAPIDREQQAIFFYMYCDDVDAKHAELTRLGLHPSEIRKPFYAPRGEFSLADPDGYGLAITHT
jgi:hypothetical protein